MGQPEAKGESCSMDTIFHASLAWIMGWSTHSWNVSSPGQQTEAEPSLAVQGWPRCTAAEVHNAALAASCSSPLSQGAILLNSSHSEQPWEEILHQLLIMKWPLRRAGLPLSWHLPRKPWSSWKPRVCVSLAAQRYFQSHWLIVSEMQGKAIPSKWHLSHAPSHDL